MPQAPVLLALVLRALVLPALVHVSSTGATSTGASSTGTASTGAASAGVTSTLLLQIKGQCITSTSAINTLLGVELAKKNSPGREKLAPIDWHDWHVFATLIMHYLAELMSEKKFCSNFAPSLGSGNSEIQKYGQI